MALSGSKNNPSGGETQGQGRITSTAPELCRSDVEQAHITICSASATCDCDCEETRRVLEEEIVARNLEVRIGDMKLGCNGDCPYGPIVGFPRKGLFYSKVSPKWAKEVVSATLEKGHVVFDLLHIDPLKSTSSRILYDRPGFIATIDDSYCMVRVAYYFLKFEEGVSCGKCVPCRVGSVELREILARIIAGQGRLEDLQRIELVCKAMQEAPYCDFAVTTSDPVVTILKHFRSEFESHVDQGICPAGVCEALTKEEAEQATE
jgi:(2Fe-2S) ferredoxin